MRTRAAPLAGAHLHGHARTGLSRIALVVDTPAVLLQRHDALGRRLAPLMLARRGEPEHPVAQTSGRHRRTEPRFQLVPGSVGFERRDRRRLQFQIRVRSDRRATVSARCRCRPGRESARSVRSPRCCQSNEPDPPASGPDTPRRPRACQRSSCARSTSTGAPGCLGAVAQPAPSASTLTRHRTGNCRCMAVADQFGSFCRRCFSSSLSG